MSKIEKLTLAEISSSSHVPSGKFIGLVMMDIPDKNCLVIAVPEKLGWMLDTPIMGKFSTTDSKNFLSLVPKDRVIRLFSVNRAMITTSQESTKQVCDNCGWSGTALKTLDIVFCQNCGNVDIHACAQIVQQPSLQ